MVKFDRIAQAIENENIIVEEKFDSIAREIERKSNIAKKAWVTRREKMRKQKELEELASKPIPFISNTILPRKTIKIKISKNKNDSIDNNFIETKNYNQLTPGQKMRLTKLRLKKEREEQKNGNYCKYNGEGKTNFRDYVVNKIKIRKPKGLILALESEELRFVSRLPDYRFVIFEKNKDIYKSIVKSAKTISPNIIAVYRSDVKKMVEKTKDLKNYINQDCYFDYAFLDFCSTFQTNISKLYRISHMLNNTLYIAFTFCLRGNKKDMESYKCDIIKKLQHIFRNHEFDYETMYKDGAPMFGVILKHRDIEV